MKTENIPEGAWSVIQHVLGNWIADINQPPSIFCSPICRKDVPYWILEEGKSLELDVYSEVHSMTLPGSCVLLALPSCLSCHWELQLFFDAFQTPSGYPWRLLGQLDELFFNEIHILISLSGKVLVQEIPLLQYKKFGKTVCLLPSLSSPLLRILFFCYFTVLSFLSSSTFLSSFPGDGP